MRIDTLKIRNFKGYVEQDFVLHPHFNLVVGINGSGKTSLLEALAIAASAWYLGIPEISPRTIYRDEVRQRIFETDGDANLEPQLPSEILASGRVMGQNIEWQRSVVSVGGATRQNHAKELKKLASEAAKAVQDGKNISLPILAFYGTDRLSAVSREEFLASALKSSKYVLRSRMAAYQDSFRATISVDELIRYFSRQTQIAQQHNKREDFPGFAHVKQAILSCIDEAKSVMFDARLTQIIVTMNDGSRLPFSQLSDGFRMMLAMVGDIARRILDLNPQMAAQACQTTAGIVLIDELDLHLHPAWQRRIIENLRKTFPNVQFICTSHSPFLIQSLRSNEELVMLSGNSSLQLGNLSLAQIAEDVQGVPNTDASIRYADMVNAGKDYLRGATNNLNLYADNPAFQAFLEMKRAAILED